VCVCVCSREKDERWSGLRGFKSSQADMRRSRWNSGSGVCVWVPACPDNNWVKQDAVRDGRLRFRCRHLANLTKHACSLVLAYSLHYTITKPEVQNIYCSVVRGGRATAISVTCKEFGEIWTCGFWDKWADRQIDRQTYRHADRNTSPNYRANDVHAGSSSPYYITLHCITLKLFKVA